MLKYCLYFILGILTFPSLAQEKLIFAIDIIRHGDRTPLIASPEIAKIYPEGTGLNLKPYTIIKFNGETVLSVDITIASPLVGCRVNTNKAKSPNGFQKSSMEQYSIVTPDDIVVCIQLCSCSNRLNSFTFSPYFDGRQTPICSIISYDPFSFMCFACKTNST